MKKVTLVLFLVYCLIITACSGVQTRGQAGAAIGAGSGAILGQAIGRDTEGTLLGTAIGGILGYIFGNEMDKADRTALHNVFESGRTGEVFSWNNNNGVRRNAVVTNTFRQLKSDNPCRKVVLMGEGARDEIVLCRNSRGQWYMPQ